MLEVMLTEKISTDYALNFMKIYLYLQSSNDIDKAQAITVDPIRKRGMVYFTVKSLM